MSAVTPVRPALGRRSVEHFLQSAFVLLQDDVAAGQEVPFTLEERRNDGGPSLYEYALHYDAFVEERAARLAALAEYRPAVSALASDPAVVALARAHAADASPSAAVSEVVLLPLLIGAAEACGGFAYDEVVFDDLWRRLDEAVRGSHRSYAAFVPLIGVRSSLEQADLGLGVSLRRISPAEIAQRWPEAADVLPERTGIAADRCHGLEIDLALPREEEEPQPNAAAAFARALTALRLVHGPAIGAGPCFVDRTDWAARVVHPLPAAAGIARPADPVVLDGDGVALARALAARIEAVEGAALGPIAIGMARYSFAAAQESAAVRAAGLFEALDAIIGDDGAGPAAVALRAAALGGSTAAERQRIAADLRLARTAGAGGLAPEQVDRVGALLDDLARTAIVAALELEAGQATLAGLLDDVLLGARPRPQVVSGVARSRSLRAV